MSETSNNLFSNPAVRVYEAAYIEGENWWLDDTGKNWWNRKTYFPFNAVYLTKIGNFDLKINGTWYRIEPHRVVFIPAGSELEFYFDGNGTLEKYFVHFDLEFGVGELASCFDVPCLFAPSDESRLENLFLELKKRFRAESAADAIAANGAMISLAAEVILQSGASFVDANKRLPKDMRETVEYIERNCYKPISVATLAQKAGYSATYFTKKFVSTFGCTPSEYIADVKIEHAKRWLGEKKMTVSEISYALGFSDPGYFSNFFKSKTGLSPAYYRKNIND